MRQKISRVLSTARGAYDIFKKTRSVLEIFSSRHRQRELEG